MTRTGLFVALTITAVTGFLFGIFPQLDLDITSLFFDADVRDFKLTRYVFLDGHGWVLFLRDASMWVVAALAMPPAVALVVKVVRPSKPLLVSGPAIVFLLGTLALAPGLVANGLLKEYGGRPRPIEVSQFGGTDRFVAWWDPRGGCDKNCSFVSGEATAAFWTLAPAALAPAPMRALAYATALVFAAAVGTMRIAFGGHFFTDVAFAGIFTFLIIWIAHGLCYRWAMRWISDATLERTIERVVLPVHVLIAAVLAWMGSVVRRAAQRGSGSGS